MFGSMVGFFGGRLIEITLFLVWLNPRWWPWHELTEDIDKMLLFAKLLWPLSFL